MATAAHFGNLDPQPGHLFPGELAEMDAPPEIGE